ncbi:MAG TPA: 3,4-dihydroxy-2-butanone-4-phosphate synthase [Flavobacteriales bacterium]|jgi:3,4-dihydroxy 2-butanone 4-phosphate synthase/GTP cyclohydrolase II|nr:3,4-dihydroxy-2-butanone-4-phosphate synthase [Flavobacteriales bacterium]
MSSKPRLNTIEEAIEDIKNGKVVIVVDDENRENEGDFIAAAERVTPEMINFMASMGRGLICVPLTEDRCHELNLPRMVGNTTDPQETAFTVSVDLSGNGNTTGISAEDRYRTIKALVNRTTKPTDLNRPGHVFPLIAKKGGVLRRTGHTEAAIDLARLAGLDPSGVIVEIMNDDGSMARLPQLIELAKKLNVRIISIEDLIAYRLSTESLIERVFEHEQEIDGKKLSLIGYRQITTGENHIALTYGEINPNKPVLVRVHSSYIKGSIFDSCHCSTGPQLFAALEELKKEGQGVIVYLQQEHSQTTRYKQSREGIDAVDAKLNSAMKIDPRDYGIGAQILRDLNIRKMKVMSSSATKRKGLIGYGLEVTDYVSLS